MRKILPWVAIAVLCGAAAVAYFLLRPAAQPVPEPVVEATAPPAPQPTIAPPATAEPLPALDDSDATVRDGLAGILGQEAVVAFLVPDSFIRKIVATVDNLPRQKLDMRIRAVRALQGSFMPEGNGDTVFVLGPATYSRYEPFMRVVDAADPEGLADLYVRLYPLLQQAYEELGYPERQFHVRLLEAIDDMLAAPEIEGPVPLVRPHVLYEFADKALEARSAGQKALLRIGPQHAARLKEKLTAFRADIVARSTAGPGGLAPH